MTCPFCTINTVRNRILEEGELTRVLFSNPRLMKGHLLVMPKRHVEQPWDLTADELQEMFLHIHALQKKLSKTLGTGCDIRQNYRPFITQGRLKVDHLHVHLLPRSFEDELYKKSMKFETALFTDVPEGEVDEVRRVLSATDN